MPDDGLPRHVRRLAVGRLSRDIYGEKGVKAHCALEYWFAGFFSLAQSVLHNVTCICSGTETFLCRTIVFLRFLSVLYLIFIK